MIEKYELKGGDEVDTVNVFTKNDTYVLSTYPRGNFSKEFNLYVGRQYLKRRGMCEEEIAETLIYFELENLKNAKVVIKEAYLQLYVGRYEKCWCRGYYDIKVKVNQSKFDSEKVNYCNKPVAIDYKVVHLPINHVCEGYINLEVTDLIKSWITNEIPNYGMTLSSEIRNAFIEFESSRWGRGPTLVINYDQVPVERGGGGVQLQVKNQQSELILQDHPIIFDQIITPDNQLIRYDLNTGEIVIETPGYYMFEWWVALEGAGIVTELILQLQNTDKSIQIKGNAPINPITQITGNALINITGVPQKFQLVNNSGDTIQLATTGVQGSIIVGKIG